MTTQAPTITLTPVTTSAAVKGYHYDAATKQLHLQFAEGGKVFTHYEVPQDIADGFVASESMGRFLADNIRGKFSTKPPAEEPAEA